VTVRCRDRAPRMAGRDLVPGTLATIPPDPRVRMDKFAASRRVAPAPSGVKRRFALAGEPCPPRNKFAKKRASMSADETKTRFSTASLTKICLRCDLMVSGAMPSPRAISLFASPCPINSRILRSRGLSDSTKEASTSHPPRLFPRSGAPQRAPSKRERSHPAASPDGQLCAYSRRRTASRPHQSRERAVRRSVLDPVQGSRHNPLALGLVGWAKARNAPCPRGGPCFRLRAPPFAGLQARRSSRSERRRVALPILRGY
jgi:hypothetical protein